MTMFSLQRVMSTYKSANCRTRTKLLRVRKQRRFELGDTEPHSTEQGEWIDEYGLIFAIILSGSQKFSVMLLLIEMARDHDSW